MKYLTEYRDGAAAEKVAAVIARTVTRPWTIMEVCGGQTHTIVKYGLDAILPRLVELVHGPGCPVCVTPLEMIDRAHAIARKPGVIFCSFGDMLRVPGSNGDLFQVKAEGGDVRIVYSPLDCLRIAQANPSKQVVFFAIGFETTAPANAMAVWQARAQNIRPIVTTARRRGGGGPLTRSLLRIDRRVGDVVLSALKQAEDRSSTIVRVFNPGDEAASVVLRLDVPIVKAFVVNFLEERQEALAIEDGGVSLVLAPKRIQTIEFVGS